MRVSLERQRELYDSFADQALDELVTLLQTRGPELVALGRKRAFEQVGVHEYGDSTYWLPPERLDEEVAAELADAVFYLQVTLARAAGALEPAD